MRSSSRSNEGVSARASAATTSRETPARIAMGPCAANSYPAFHAAPTTIIASSFKRASRDVPYRTYAPSSWARWAKPGLSNQGANGPATGRSRERNPDFPRGPESMASSTRVCSGSRSWGASGPRRPGGAGMESDSLESNGLPRLTSNHPDDDGGGRRRHGSGPPLAPTDVRARGEGRRAGRGRPFRTPIRGRTR